MNTRLKAAIISLAHASPVTEVCGLLYQDERGVHIHPCSNITQDEEGPSRAFEISDEEYTSLSQRARVCGIYHSHGTGGAAAFSESDIELATVMELPIYLYIVGTGAWLSYVPPTYEVPLLSQPWQWGFSDCYETIRTYYRQTKGVHLGDYDRDESFEKAEQSAILQYVAAEGFTTLPATETSAPDDVLVFTTGGGAYPHHLGVLLTGQQFLHHPIGALSRRDPLDGRWLKRLHQVLRYTGKTVLA